MHRTILSAFPPCVGDARAQHGVLHRIESNPDTRRVTILVQSGARPDWSRLPKGYLALGSEPEVKSVAGSYAAIQTGMRLAFRLRANPTRKIDTKTGPDGQKRNGRRVKLQGEREQIDWLLRKAAASGFEVLDVYRTLETAEVGYNARAVDGGGATEKGRLFFNSVLFEGYLQVTDADRFRQTLAAGIGSGKAYGFGLMSIAPR